jgi:hypothetical protein
MALGSAKLRQNHQEPWLHKPAAGTICVPQRASKTFLQNRQWVMDVFLSSYGSDNPNPGAEVKNGTLTAPVELG